MQEKFSRTDSDAGVTGDLMRQPWTIDEVRIRALGLGKKFEPNPEIADRVSYDLSKNGVIVLFTPEEVTEAVSMGAVSKEEEEDLMNLVSKEGLNDVAIIPVGVVEEAQRQKLFEWFLANRC